MIWILLDTNFKMAIWKQKKAIEIFQCQKFIRKYKLEHMTVYGFRHSYSTFMSEKGMDREVLRELMGHADK